MRNKVKKIITLLLTLCLIIFNAKGQNIYFYGKVKSKSQLLAGANVLFTSKQKNVMTATDSTGFYRLRIDKLFFSDTVQISVSHINYKASTYNLILNSDSIQKDFELNQDSVILNMENVTVFARKHLNLSDRIIYTPNMNDFLKTSKANAVVQLIPNISLNEMGLFYNNSMHVTIFINGIEATIEELKEVDAKEISKIEVITSPSGKFSVGANSIVVNIKLKKASENYYKGTLNLYVGIRQNLYGGTPTFSFKRKKIIIRFMYNYNHNNQLITTSYERKFGTLISLNNNQRSVSGFQNFFSARSNYELSKNSYINLNAYMFRYNFEGKTESRFILNNDTSNSFIFDKEGLQKWYIAPIFAHNFTEKSRIFEKVRFLNHLNTFDINQSDISSVSRSNISKFRELTNEIVYEIDSLKIFKKISSFSFGNKIINRDYYFLNTNFYLNQKLIDLYITNDYKFSNKLSLATSLYYSYSINKNSVILKNYSNLLPTLSMLYTLNNKNTIRAEFSKNLLWPNPENLNPTPIYLNPSNILQGNKYLLPQFLYSYSANYSRTVPKGSITFRPFIQYLSNAITNSYLSQDSGVIITTYTNASRNISYGLNLGFAYKFFKTLNLNCNFGSIYYDLKASGNNILINSNQGLSYNYSIFLSQKIKNKAILNLSSYYRSPTYTLISRVIENPTINFSAEIPIFKDRFTFEINYKDIFCLGANKRGQINTNDFYEYYRYRNNMTNLSFSISYNFGKTFNDRFQNPIINNNDINLK